MSQDYGSYHGPKIEDADFITGLTAPCVCGNPEHWFYNAPSEGGWCLYNPKRDGPEARRVPVTCKLR